MGFLMAVGEKVNAFVKEAGCFREMFRVRISVGDDQSIYEKGWWRIYTWRDNE